MILTAEQNIAIWVFIIGLFVTVIPATLYELYKEVKIKLTEK